MSMKCLMAIIALILAFILPGCTPKTRTILIKPPPCVLPEWPAAPVIYLVEPCPEGLACITVGDHKAIVYHEADLERIHQVLRGCPNVVFKALPDPN